MRPVRRRARRQRQAGFTLIELMVALVMFSFAIAGVLAVAVSMVQGYRETRGAIAAENAVRVPMDFIIDSLRQASPGVDSGKITDGASCTTSAMSVTNSSAGPDQLDVIYAAGAVVTYTQPAESLGAITSMPYTATVPASSNCVTYTSSVLFSALASVTASASGSAATSTGTAKASSSTVKASTTGTSASASSTASSGADALVVSGAASLMGVVFAGLFLA